MQEFFIGLILAMSSCSFIGTSFVVKKKALLRSAANNNKRAGQGGHMYLREWMWWAGLTLLGVGEACNFAAFAFAPASLVASLGATSVLVTVVLSSYVLKEKLGFLGKIGCGLCVLGATMVVLHAPREGKVRSMVELGEKMQEYGFIIYASLLLVVSLFLIFYVGPKYGQKNIFVFIGITTLIGSMTVLGCKGLGLAVKEGLNYYGQDSTGDSLLGVVKNPLTWVWLGVVVFCVTVQLNFLNKALDFFNISMVTSIQYVAFTAFVTISSGILYQEWSNLASKDILGSLCGFFTTVIGVFQMQCFNDLEISWHHLMRQMYKANRTVDDPRDHDDEETIRTRRRRSLLENSQSEPLLCGNPLADVRQFCRSSSMKDNRGGYYDEKALIPVHSLKFVDETRGLSV